MTFHEYLTKVNAHVVSPVTKALMMKAFEAGQRAVQGEPVGSKKLYALACLLSGRKGDQYITRVTLHTRFADSEEEAKGSAVSFVLEENPDLAVDQVLCTEVRRPEQKLAPEVAGLVEALEAIVSHHDEYFNDSGTESKMPWIKQARAALAAYRKQGDES